MIHFFHSDLLKLDSKNVAALYVKALCYYYQDMPDRATQFFQQALRLDPDHSKSRMALKVFLPVVNVNLLDIIIIFNLSNPSILFRKRKRATLCLGKVGMRRPIRFTLKLWELMLSMCTPMQSCSATEH